MTLRTTNCCVVMAFAILAGLAPGAGFAKGVFKGQYGTETLKARRIAVAGSYTRSLGSFTVDGNAAFVARCTVPCAEREA